MPSGMRYGKRGGSQIAHAGGFGYKSAVSGELDKLKAGKVKTLADMSPEEKAELEKKYGMKIKEVFSSDIPSLTEVFGGNE
jgi:hypothetical protein